MSDARAREILRRNDRGGYTVPTDGLYPYQWLWDSAFCAMGFAEFDLPRAWAEIDAILAPQWADGMLPHITFRGGHVDSYFPGPRVWRAGNGALESSGCSQPPIHTIAVQRLLELDRSEAALERARAIAPKLLASHRWYHEARDPEAEGIIKIIHPWESGRDNCPDWDAALARVEVDPELEPYARKDTGHVDAAERPSRAQYDRYLTLLKFGRERGWDHRAFAAEGPFWAADPGLTFILHRADEALLWILDRLGIHEGVDEIEGWRARTAAGVDALWSEALGAFCAMDARTYARVEGISSAAFLALYAGLGSPTQRARLLEHLDAFLDASAGGVPSWDPRDARFEPKRYWRGPVWPQMDMLISEGLRARGEVERAERVGRGAHRLISKAGFYECFDGITGAGRGGDAFSWTAAIWLAWARHFRA